MAYTMKTKPFSHQARITPLMQDQEGYALFWEQGCGKSKPMIDNIGYLWEKKLIDAVLVVAPNGVHLNWVTDEIPAHMPDQIMRSVSMHAWSPASAATQWHSVAVDLLVKHPGLAVLTVPVESFTTQRCKKAVWKFLAKRKVFYVLDEGITIKSPSAKRSISVVASAKYARYRRLLNGTPIAKEPWDVFQQMKFINPDFWKPHELDSIEVMRTHFGRWQKIEAKDGRPSFDMCIGHRRLGELQEILKSASDRVLKEDVLDLPPKLFSKARFEMTKEQWRHYEEIKEDYLTWLTTLGKCETCQGKGEVDLGNDYVMKCEACGGTGLEKGGLLTADLAVTRLLRLQQITCGYLPTPLGEGDEPFHQFKENPRLERFTAWAKNLSHGCIVWSRFTKDIDLILEQLKAAKLTACRYDGKTSEKDRAEAKYGFNAEKYQFFVANPAAISMGVTLLPAKTLFYYANDYNLVRRKQSEDRSHRIGQKSSVHIIDCMADNTVDRLIIQSHRDKVEISNQVTGDKVKEWI